MNSGAVRLQNTLRRKYEFGWEVLEGLIGGRSVLDTPQGLMGYSVRSAAEVDRFIRSYGFDIENPIENAELLGNLREAIEFIRRHFLQPENPEGLKIEFPRKIQELSEVRELFLMASDAQGNFLKHWACSILKVMHTIAHLDRDLRAPYFPEIQKQILDRFYKIVQREEGGALFLGENHEDPLRVQLIEFESKPKKSRDSTLLKLLHKPENVAEDIFDRVGVRFVTRTRLDSIRVVKYLKDSMIVMPVNIKPSRSRNSLIDLESLEKEMNPLLDQLESGKLTEEEFQSRMELKVKKTGKDPNNPHSSSDYRAIQFTGRQLVKIVNPVYDDLRDLKGLAKGLASVPGAAEDASKILDRINLKFLQREVCFFYPYEVQIMDQVSAEENEKGRGAHSEYKKAQVQTAMKRVMRGFLEQHARV